VEGIWCRYDRFRKRPTRYFRVAVTFRLSRFGAFATFSDLADGIDHTGVETDSIRHWFTKSQVAISRRTHRAVPPRVPDVPGWDVRALTRIHHTFRAPRVLDGYASIEQARDRLLPCDAFAVQQFLGVASHGQRETTIAGQPVESRSDRLRLRI
jgi:hypothetical protein